MTKRSPSREASLSSALSSTTDLDDDVATDNLQNPPKRLKTADGSAAASPTRANVREPEDEEMQDDEVEVETEKRQEEREAKPRLHSRPSIKTERGHVHESEPEPEPAGEAEAEVDADVEGDAEDAIVLQHNNGEATEAIEPSHGSLLETLSSVSEDTDGDVPLPTKGSSAKPHHLSEDDVHNNEQQVTVCAWEDCSAGDLQTMDKLVEHLHSEHVEGKQRRYTCDWVGCARKSKSHASAYALKAHLRSHTREKPHVCLLPECDLAFARQDALNKHMRTAHDIDLMRSFDPTLRTVQVGLGKHASGAVHGAYTNGHSNNNNNGVVGGTSAGVNGSATQGKSGTSKLKIIIKTPQSHAAGQDDSVDYGSSSHHHGYTFVNEAGAGAGGGADTTVLTREQGFSARELDMPLEKLHGLCRCQLRWVEDEGEALRKECATWEELYHQAWLEQQVLLSQVIKSEKDWHRRRKAVLASLAAEEAKRAETAAAAKAAKGPDVETEVEADVDADADVAAVADEGKDEDEDSAAEEDNDNDNDNDNDEDNDEDDENEDNDGDDDDDDGDDDAPSVTLDPDATRDDVSFADVSSFSAVGSSLRNEVTVNGRA